MPLTIQPAQKAAIVKHAELGLGVIEKPIEGETLPGQRGKERVVESKAAGGDQRQCQENEKSEHVKAIAQDECGVLVWLCHDLFPPNFSQLCWRASDR